jgi:hypothetical protein
MAHSPAHSPPHSLHFLFSSLVTEQLTDFTFDSPETRPYPAESNPLLAELTTYLEQAGLSDPFSKIYITTEGLLENFALFCFLLIIHQIKKYVYNERIGTAIYFYHHYDFKLSNFTLFHFNLSLSLSLFFTRSLSLLLALIRNQREI